MIENNDEMATNAEFSQETKKVYYFECEESERKATVQKWGVLVLGNGERIPCACSMPSKYNGYTYKITYREESNEKKLFEYENIPVLDYYPENSRLHTHPYLKFFVGEDYHGCTTYGVKFNELEIRYIEKKGTEKMDNLNEIKVLYNEIETVSEELQNYSDGYICDIISEIADSNINIYTYDLFNWLKDNMDAVDEAVAELGMPSANDSNIIIKLCQQGQYVQNQNTLYNELDEAMFNWCLNWLEVEGFETITDEELEALQNRCENVDNNDQLEDWSDFLKELMGIEE